MLKENYFLLESSSHGYHAFYTLLKENFSGLQAIQYTDELMDAVCALTGSRSFWNNHVFVIFVEYPQVSVVSSLLHDLLDPFSYILVTYYKEPHQILMPVSGNLFEHIFTDFSLFHSDYYFAKLRCELEKLRRIFFLKSEMRSFYDIGKALASEKDSIRLFEKIIDSSMDMTASDAGTLYLIVDQETGSWSSIKNSDCSRKFFKFAISRTLSVQSALETSTMPITRESIAGYTAITGRTQNIEDAYRIDDHVEYHHNSSFDRRTGFITKSILSIPMKDHQDNILGVIQLINKKKDKTELIDYSDPERISHVLTYDTADVMVMESMAGLAAVALENNLLYRDMEALLKSYEEQNRSLTLLSRKILKAHEEERKRIAREIHDGAAQSAANLAIKLEICKKILERGEKADVMKELDTLGNNVRNTVNEIRGIIYDLKPSYLENGLIMALKNHIESFTENTGIKVMFTANGDDNKIEYYLVSTLFRIAQEALSNIYKHARADLVKVDLEIGNGCLSLILSDNGVGFETAGLTQKRHKSIESGFGLEGIMERVELIKGSISITSQSGSGTVLSIKVPLAS